MRAQENDRRTRPTGDNRIDARPEPLIFPSRPVQARHAARSPQAMTSALGHDRPKASVCLHGCSSSLSRPTRFGYHSTGTRHERKSPVVPWLDEAGSSSKPWPVTPPTSSRRRTSPRSTWAAIGASRSRRRSQHIGTDRYLAHHHGESVKLVGRDRAACPRPAWSAQRITAFAPTPTS